MFVCLFSYETANSNEPKFLGMMSCFSSLMWITLRVPEITGSTDVDCATLDLEKVGSNLGRWYYRKSLQFCNGAATNTQNIKRTFHIICRKSGTLSQWMLCQVWLRWATTTPRNCSRPLTTGSLTCSSSTTRVLTPSSQRWRCWAKLEKNSRYILFFTRFKRNFEEIYIYVI